MKNQKEIYFSVDVETDGPIPSEFSMLSLGCAAFNTDGKMLDTFSINLKPLPDAKQNPDTMAFWERNKDAYAHTQEDQIDAKEGMHRFSNWIKSVCKLNDDARPVFIGYPAGFDFLFVYWYLLHFTGFSPFSFSALDIKTYAMAVLKTNYRDSTKKNFPKRWFSEGKHTHVAIDDAIEQGELFIAMLKENTKK